MIMKLNGPDNIDPELYPILKPFDSCLKKNCYSKPRGVFSVFKKAGEH